MAAGSRVQKLNPCPCGYAGDPSRRCHCTPKAARRYLGRLSGPLLDRIDLHVPLPAVSLDDLQSRRPGESSAEVRKRVVAAREIQRERHRKGETSAACNARLSQRDLDRVAPSTKESRALLRTAVQQYGLSARAYLRIRRLARTLSDLEGSDAVGHEQIAEAIQARCLDRDPRMQPAL